MLPRSVSSSAGASTCPLASSPPSSPSAPARRRSSRTPRSSSPSPALVRSRSPTRLWTRTASPRTRPRPACRQRCSDLAGPTGPWRTASSLLTRLRLQAGSGSTRASSTRTTSLPRSVSGPKAGSGSRCCPRLRSNAWSGSRQRDGSCRLSWTSRSQLRTRAFNRPTTPRRWPLCSFSPSRWTGSWTTVASSGLSRVQKAPPRSSTAGPSAQATHGPS